MKFFNIPKSVAFVIASGLSAFFVFAYYTLILATKKAMIDPVWKDTIDWEPFLELMRLGFGAGVFAFLLFGYGAISCGIEEYNEYRKKSREETDIGEDSRSN